MRYVAAHDPNGHFVLDTRHNIECICTRYSKEDAAQREADRMNRVYAGMIEATAALKLKIAAEA